LPSSSSLRGCFSPRGGRTPASSSSSQWKRRSVYRAPRPSTTRASSRSWGSSTTAAARSGEYGKTIDVVFKGRSAHAGLAPEEGRSAIAAAGRAIADLRLGRIDEETTANVGLIEGGTGRNVVPDRCSLAAEARSRDEGKLAELVQEILDAFTFAAAVAECEVETRISETYAGYRFRPDDPVFALAASALRGAGLEPNPIDVGGGADANVFNARGVPCVNLANGMMQVHTPSEHIAVADLETMLAVTLELVDAARHA